MAALQNTVPTLKSNNVYIVCAFTALSFNRNGDICSGLSSFLAYFKGLLDVRYMWDDFSFIKINPHFRYGHCFVHCKTENLRPGKNKWPAQVQAQIKKAVIQFALTKYYFSVF